MRPLHTLCLAIFLLIGTHAMAQTGKIVNGTYYLVYITYHDVTNAESTTNIAFSQLPQSVSRKSLKDFLCSMLASGTYVDDPTFASGFSDVHKNHMSEPAAIKQYNAYQDKLASLNRICFKTRMELADGNYVYVDFVKVDATYEVRPYKKPYGPHYLQLPAACTKGTSYSFVGIKRSGALSEAEKAVVTNREGFIPVNFDGEPIRR